MNTAQKLNSSNSTAITANRCYKQPDCELHYENCLETMQRIETASVKLMLTDPPYATTQNKWDKPINIPELWIEWERILADDGVWVFTASEPFASELIMSRRGFFKYDLIWNKKRPTGHLNKDLMPLRQHEQILIFAKGKHTYNPQMHENKLDRDFRGAKMKPHTPNYGKQKEYVSELDPKLSYPRSIWEFTAVIGNSKDKLPHPNQKPLSLFRELVKTYSNENDLVFDGYVGSGTTAMACVLENRKFIGSENNQEFFDLSVNRLDSYFNDGGLFSGCL